MNSPSSKNWLLPLLLTLGFAGEWQLQQRIDGQRAAMHQERDELVLRSGKLVKAMSLEYAPLMADIYWTRVVQYYGDKRARHDPDFELLWPLLDLTTTLTASVRHFWANLRRGAPDTRNWASLCCNAGFRPIPSTGDFMKISVSSIISSCRTMRRLRRRLRKAARTLIRRSG